MINANDEDCDTDIPHVADVTKRDAQEGKIELARDDDGTLYHVSVNEWDGSARFDRRRTDEEMAARLGAGETCARCGNRIGIRDIIVNDKDAESVEHYHVGCWEDA